MRNQNDSEKKQKLEDFHLSYVKKSKSGMLRVCAIATTIHTYM